MSDALSVTVGNGKYTVIQAEGGGMRFLRHGEPWEAADRDFKHVGLILALAQEVEALRAPIPMILFCPNCGVQHVDEPGPGWDNPPHRSHLCAGCGHIWRPADVATNGVREIKTAGAKDSSPRLRGAATLGGLGIEDEVIQSLRWHVLQRHADAHHFVLLRHEWLALFNAALAAKRLRAWVSDLQSGMYVNCVYCGHRYGPEKDTPVAMADVLKEHIRQCPEHPLSKAHAALVEVNDCFEAAKTEGLQERLEERDGDRGKGSLEDLVIRRLLPAWVAAREYLEDKT